MNLIEAKHPALYRVLLVAMTDSDKSYLIYMAARLLEIHRILKPTGSIYLHCDPTMSHYLKLVMDAVFGVGNFRDEVVWKRFNFHADARRFGAISDRVLFYSKSKDYVFNRPRVHYSKEYIAAKLTHQDESGRRFRLSDLNPPAGRGPVYEFHGVSRAWRITEDKMRELEKKGYIYSDSKVPQLKRYLDELPGQAVADMWTDVKAINSQAKERVGYPTQKPLALLDRIIKASSNSGDMVLDPFCGCATTCISAQGLGVHSQDIVQKGKSADRRQATQALMLPVMIIEVKPGAKPANTVA